MPREARAAAQDGSALRNAAFDVQPADLSHSKPQAHAMRIALQTVSLGAPGSVAPWPTLDPFLFCVHHKDAYPAGDEKMAPKASLAGRHMGQDFAGKDGFRMYHGMTVPGFPAHPHRGFETVTIAREGYIDHSDSLGAAARFGQGDVQWLTTGAGIVHAEMFPLREREKGNPAELFQIWLNLPRASKMAKPYFSMLWSEEIPERQGKNAKVNVIAGTFDGTAALAPPPDSWASRAESDLAIWTIRIGAGGSLTLPKTNHTDTIRTLYFFEGKKLEASHEGVRESFPAHHAIVVIGDAITLHAEDDVEVLVMQARPIGEPVVSHGPFVMNTKEEIMQTFKDYERTRFGGWPWPNQDPVHAREEGRFARHADGRVEKRG
jgi:redox-sensitive bicupin YhaK (pirin superfamily)